MAKFNEYSQKATPEDADSLMIYDATAKANKLSLFSGIWNWIVGKLTNAVISNLQTSNQTVVGALNELSRNKVGQNEIDNVYVRYVEDLNNPPRAFILNTGVNPIGLPPQLRSNSCLVIQQNPSDNLYTAQLAFSFGSDKIAIRRKSGTDSWSEWKYFTAQ